MHVEISDDLNIRLTLITVDQVDCRLLKGNPYKFDILIATKPVECPLAFQFQTAAKLKRLLGSLNY